MKLSFHIVTQTYRYVYYKGYIRFSVFGVEYSFFMAHHLDDGKSMEIPSHKSIQKVFTTMQPKNIWCATMRIL